MTRNNDQFKTLFNYGDLVQFDFESNGQIQVITGTVEIIDKYGTFEQNEEPSYDLYRKENNTLYKHIRQSELKKADDNNSRDNTHE